MEKDSCESGTPTKTAKVLGLFLAAVLAAGTGGCTAPFRSGHTHVDSNRDGYCDEDGEPMNSSGSRWFGGSHYFGRNYFPSTTGTDMPAATAGGKISSGSSAAKGGIGSHSSGSGG